MKGFYYLHENGDLIFKKFRPEEDPGGFVRRVWTFDAEQRSTAWLLCIEALALGATKARVDELAAKWSLTDDDALIFVEHSNGELCLSKDGDQWCATFGDFVNLQESQAGFGTTALAALAELAKPGFVRR
jgi:hypothetical protein